jgi:BirA family transcriptional regulator, biotin operon repressor / biotin---[acetyl-CoA-carboxylase] ligase
VIATAPVRHFVTIDSTNAEARRLHGAGEGGPLWLLADEQTAGKGRLGRSWASTPGNCYSTLVLPLPRTPLSAVAQIGFAVALAVAETVDRLGTKAAAIKWPNDVLVGAAKISGILCEVLQPAPLVVAIGCGINVAHAPQGLPYPATSIQAEGVRADRDQVFETYRQRLAYLLSQWNEGENFDMIRAQWLSRAIGLGETVSMTKGDTTVSGRYEGISPEGAVVLKPASGPSQVFHAGDLHIPSLAALRNGTR